MGRVEDHLDKYRKLKADAGRDDISRELRAEAYFLAAFHLIDARAARHNVHIDKHKNVKRELEANDLIFGKDTTEVRRLFEPLERDLRPRFVYGFKWSDRDFVEVERVFRELEALCQKVAS